MYKNTCEVNVVIRIARAISSQGTWKHGDGVNEMCANDSCLNLWQSLKDT